MDIVNTLAYYKKPTITIRVESYKGLHSGRLQPYPQILD